MNILVCFSTGAFVLYMSRGWIADFHVPKYNATMWCIRHVSEFRDNQSHHEQSVRFHAIRTHLCMHMQDGYLSWILAFSKCCLVCLLEHGLFDLVTPPSLELLCTAQSTTCWAWVPEACLLILDPAWSSWFCLATAYSWESAACLKHKNLKPVFCSWPAFSSHGYLLIACTSSAHHLVSLSAHHLHTICLSRGLPAHHLLIT